MLILHLSDLHFGAHSRFRELEPALLAEGFLAQLEASRERLGIASEVELVIATGDFAETGHPREFKQAGAFLGAVVDDLGLPRRRTVLLPGNHDVSWPRCKSAENQQAEEEFASSLTLDTAQPDVLDFAAIEILSASGRVGGRALVAQLQTSPQYPLTRLMAAACRLSLDHGDETEAFQAAMAEAKRQRLDRLWPALARHLARRSDDEDRHLLTHRVATAHEHDSPLGWGLRYVVRGDVLLGSGRVITLDELSALHQLPRLPFLEKMPDELEINWHERLDQVLDEHSSLS